MGGLMKSDANDRRTETLNNSVVCHQTEWFY